MNALSTRTPDLIAAEINGIKEQTQKMLLLNSIEIGRRLVEAKSLIPHGDWGKWLEQSVDYSKSTANNLMKIFEQYGADQFSLFGSEAKSQALGILSYTQAVALLGIPEQEREQFVQENNVHEMSTRELQKAIREKQELEKKLKEAEEKEQAERVAKEKLAKQLQQLNAEQAEWSNQAKRLEAQLEQAQASGNDAEVQRLNDSLTLALDELADSKDRVAKLEKQLKEKPLEVSAVVEKVPEAIEKELQELREKVASQGQSEAAVKFKYHFEAVVQEFKNLLAALDQVQDAESAAKYRGAVKGLIGKMSERL